MTDPDLDRWTSAWRSDAPQAPDLAHMARRERNWLRAWIAFDWAAGVAFIVIAAWLWINDGSPMMRFAAAAIVVLTVVALAFTVFNWRGSLAGETASTADFLALAERRSRARIRYIRFGWWILAADLVVIAVAYSLHYSEEGATRLPEMIAMTIAVIAAAAGVLWWWGRRERRRAERLARMRQALATDAEES